VDKGRPIVITGAAGLVGQNLVPRLEARGHTSLIAVDKHPVNTRTLSRLHPDIRVVEADLAAPGKWEEAFAGASALVLGQAQIAALEEEPFTANNIVATRNVLDAARRHGIPYIVHISSSVVHSMARDNYTETKKAQEKLVADSGISCCILRPTLLFGWFDRKHLGWLDRFLHRVPVFPIPGDGRYLRQPLYAGDFCEVIAACLEAPKPGGVYNISGQEKIDYIDLMRSVKEATGARARIVRIPYSLFAAMLRLYALVHPNPPFTVSQLKALATPDVFEVIDWPAIFGVHPTPLREALHETFQHPVYSKVVLEF